MLGFEQLSRGRPEAAWSLIAQPARWSAWAPHIRGAVGLGSPEVREGARGVVLVGFIAPVPVRIGAKQAGEFWDWHTGPLRIRHRVEPHPQGCRLSIEMHAPAPLERVLAVAYGPVIRWALKGLSTLAADAAGTA